MINQNPEPKKAELPSIIHESWHEYLQPLFEDKKMEIMNRDIIPRTPFCPKGEDVFKVFRMPMQNIKVVILGQDPYPNGEATGLAFASETFTPSLKVIYGEIARTNAPLAKVDIWSNLLHWEAQGVFLLNAALTVEFRNSGSHMGIWQWFTREVIKIIGLQVRPVWILWGSKAKAFKDYIPDKVIVGVETNTVASVSHLTNYILEGNHPAAEAYPDSKYRFSGCDHFRICNGLLSIKGNTIINW